MIYLLFFWGACFLLKLSDIYKDFRKYFFLYLGLSIPVFLATFRSSSVGTDVMTYILPMYECINNSDNFDMFYSLIRNNESTKDLEIGFITLGYIWGKYFGLKGIFFVYEAVIVLCVFATIKHFNKNISNKANVRSIPLWLGMFVFFTCFYNMSLTMIRQSTAVSIIMLSVFSFISKDYLKFFVLLFFATLIHSTALFVVAIIFLYYIINYKRKFLLFFYCCFLIAFALYGKHLYFVILETASLFIPISLRYLSSTYMNFNGEDLNIAWLYMICVSVVISYLLYTKNRTNIVRGFLFFLMISQLFLFPISVISANAGRILYYYMYFHIIVIPLLGNSINFSSKSQSSAIIVSYGVVYWIFTTLLNDITNTLDYSFDF